VWKGCQRVKVVWRIRFLGIEVRAMFASTEYFQGGMDGEFEVWLGGFLGFITYVAVDFICRWTQTRLTWILSLIY
jgi:hypothetical protein